VAKTRIVVDLGALEDTGAHLARIAADFAATDERVSDVTASMGSTNETHRLRDAVEDFAGNWKTRREELRGSVESLADMAASVANNLAEADTNLSTSLTEQQQPARPSIAGGAPGGAQVV